MQQRRGWLMTAALLPASMCVRKKEKTQGFVQRRELFSSTCRNSEKEMPLAILFFSVFLLLTVRHRRLSRPTMFTDINSALIDRRSLEWKSKSIEADCRSIRNVQSRVNPKIKVERRSLTMQDPIALGLINDQITSSRTKVEEDYL